MEVSLPPQPISPDFDDPVALSQQLENLQEGHYTQRMDDYILKETEQLVNCIDADPNLLPIREELHERIQTASFVKDILEQLGILQFEHEDFCEKVGDLEKLLEDTNTKFEEFKNYDKTRCWFLKIFYWWSRLTKKQEMCKKTRELLDDYQKTYTEIFKLTNNFLTRGLHKFVDIQTQISQDQRMDNNNVLGIDRMLRKHVMEFNVIPTSVNITVSLLTKKLSEQNKMNKTFNSFLDWFGAEIDKEKKFAVPATMMYAGIAFLFLNIVFRKRNLK